MKKDPATWGLPSVASIAGNEQALSRWRYGTIVLRSGNLDSIHSRWWPRWGSIFGAVSDQIVRVLPRDECRFHYAFPRRSPGFMSLLYVHAGEKTSYRTFHQGIVAIESIATIHRSIAIVCHVTNDRLTHRMMTRWGYETHAENVGSHHYIRRLRQ